MLKVSSSACLDRIMEPTKPLGFISLIIPAWAHDACNVICAHSDASTGCSRILTLWIVFCYGYHE